MACTLTTILFVIVDTKNKMKLNKMKLYNTK